MGVQACRLPGLKHSLGMLHPAATRHRKAGLDAHKKPLMCGLAVPVGPHINGFLWASKPAVCHPLNA